MLCGLNMSYLDILKEECSIQDQESAIKIVEAYDGLENDRVKEAIARLASGSLDGLRHFLEVAKKDYRDVLYWSESEDEARDSSERSMSGMSVNERLHHTRQFDDFDSAIKADDIEATRRILKRCFLSNENIDAIIKNNTNT
jgi:uncharacterized protein (DUF2267 family)